MMSLRSVTSARRTASITTRSPDPAPVSCRSSRSRRAGAGSHRRPGRRAGPWARYAPGRARRRRRRRRRGPRPAGRPGRGVPRPRPGAGCRSGLMVSGWRARAVNSPPAPISGSCAGSPTSTRVPPAARVWVSSAARVRVSTIEASSTTRTPPRVVRPVVPWPDRSAGPSRIRAREGRGIPVACSNRRAVTAATAAPLYRSALLGPHPGRGGDGRGLAGAGRPDHHGQSRRRGEGRDHALLLRRQAQPGGGRLYRSAPTAGPVIAQLLGGAPARPARRGQPGVVQRPPSLLRVASRTASRCRSTWSAAPSIRARFTAIPGGRDSHRACNRLRRANPVACAVRPVGPSRC